MLMICCPVQAPPRSSRNRCENEEISITASITTNSYTHTFALFPVMRLESHCLVTTYIFLQNRNGSIKQLETENEKGELCQPKKQNSPVKCEIERGRKRVRKTEKRTLKQREGSFILSIYFQKLSSSEIRQLKYHTLVKTTTT